MYKSSRKQRSSKRKKILLIDDSKDMLIIGKTFLEAQGYQVKVIQDCTIALEYLAKNKNPDLILLDMCMIEMSGKEFLDRLICQRNKNLCGLRIVYYSANDSVDLELVDGFIQKTGDIEKFIDSVEYFLNQPKRVA